MKKLTSLLNNENGNMIVILAISMVALLGAVAMVVDIGRIYHEKSVLQNAVDAAALGGAQGLLVSTNHAESIAIDIAAKNSFPITNSNITFPVNAIKVSRETTVPMTFAKVLGINEAKINATATAQIGILKTSKGVTPIAVEKNSIPSSTDLKCSNTGVNHGNCGFLDLNGNGANGLADGIINGSEIEEGAEYADTEPGQKWGPVKSAIETLISNDAEKPHCQNYESADNACDRVIIVTVIESWADAEGKDTVKVLGFAAYWIDRIEEPKRIIGHFIDWVGSGEIGGTGSGSVYGVKLVE